MAQESVLRIVIDSRNAERNARAVASELDNLTKKGDQAETQMTAMNASIKSLVGYMGGILTINKAIAMADGYTQMAARIRNATSSAEEYAMVQDRVLATANTTYRQLGEAQEVYLSMAGGMKSLGYQTTQTLDLVDSLSFSFTHNATRVDQAQSAMDALSKSMAKGKVDGDAWISIVTGADNVIADMAKTTGKTEAEIRKLGAEGKASLNDLIGTLIATREQNEQLANNMENSLADGFTKLSNEVTVYLGKTNEATSATGILAGGLSSLADNLDLVANTGAALGLGYVTTALLTKGAAVKQSLVDSAARRVADQAEMQSQVQLAAIEVQRVRQIEALAIQEVHLARLELNSATTRQARAAATMRLTQAEIALNIATKNTTVATAAYSAAQATAATTSLTLAGAARTALAFMTGPVGLGITVATVAAGYMYMSSKGEDANKMLDTQSRYAGMAADELARLGGAQRKAAEADLSKELGILNDKLEASENQFEALVEKVLDSNKTNTEAKRIWSELRAGAIGVDEAYARLNNADFVTTDQINQLTDGKKKVDDNKAAIKSANEQLEKVQVSGSKAKQGFKDAADGAKNSAEQVALLNKELADYNKGLQDREFDAVFTKNLLAKKFTEGEINALLEAANAAREKGLVATEAMYRESLRIYRLEKGNKDTIDSRNAAERKLTQEKEKQLKLGQRLIGISGNSGIGTGAHLDVRYGGSRDGQKVSKEHLARLQAGGKSLSNYRVSSDYGQRKAPTKGASSFHKGIDFAMPVGTPITTNVAVKDVKTAYDPKGGGYYSTVTFEDGVVLKLLHQAPSVLSKVKGGSSDGTLKSNQDLEKEAERQANSQLQLQMAVATERKRIETQLQEDIKEINKAGFSPEETKRLIAEYQTRADNDIAIAEYALKTKLDDYEAFKKTESQLLEDSFNERKFYAARDLELTKDQRDKAVALLDEQLKQELGYIKLAQETQLFQAKQAYMHEVDLMQERYRLEMQEIDKIADAKQRAAMREVTAAKLIDDYEKKRKAAEDNFNQVAAKIGGFEEYYAIQKEMEDAAAVMEEARKYELISEEEHKAALIEIEKRYMDAKMSLNLSYGQQIAGSVADMFKQEGDKQNKYYKAAITAEKAFSIARAMIAIKTGIALAANNPWPLNLAAMASVAAQTASIVSDIRTIHVEGFATGGKIRGAGTPTSDSIPILASDREYMVRAYAAEKLGTPTMDYINKYGELPQNTHRVGMGAVSAINSGRGSSDKATMVQPIVNIHTLPGETADISWDNGQLDVRIRKIAREEMDSYIPAQMVNPSSKVHKAVVRNTTATTKR